MRNLIFLLMICVVCAQNNTTGVQVPPTNNSTAADPAAPASNSTIESNGELLGPASLDEKNDNGDLDDDDVVEAAPNDDDEEDDSATSGSYYFERDPNSMLKVDKLNKDIDLTDDCVLYADCFNCTLSENRCSWLNGECVPPDLEFDDNSTGQAIREFANKAESCGDPLKVCSAAVTEADGSTYFGWNMTERNKNMVIPAHYFCTTSAVMAQSEEDGVDVKRTYKI